MLRTNLSTRPFYNERVVHVSVAIAAALLVALTVVNVAKVVELSRENTELSTRIGRDRAESDRLVREAARIRRGINQQELTAVVAAAREANSLIDQRTFSWTEFFNQIESTIPPNVMLSSVAPVVSDEGTRVTIIVVGKNVEDIEEFVEKLQATGRFGHLLSKLDDLTDEGLHRQILEADYVQSAATAPAAEKAR
jgi:Tfp pilus assembly protein PilN